MRQRQLGGTTGDAMIGKGDGGVGPPIWPSRFSQDPGWTAGELSDLMACARMRAQKADGNWQEDRARGRAPLRVPGAESRNEFQTHRRGDQQRATPLGPCMAQPCCLHGRAMWRLWGHNCATRAPRQPTHTPQGAGARTDEHVWIWLRGPRNFAGGGAVLQQFAVSHGCAGWSTGEL